MSRSYPLDFLLAISPDLQISAIKVDHELSSFEILPDRKTAMLYLPNNSKFIISNIETGMLAIGGDPVGLTDGSFKSSTSNGFNAENFLNTVPGHYYLIYYDKKDKSLIVSSSQFSMFPVFWCQCNECILIASRLQLMRAFLPSGLKPNKKFIIEQFLFNYPLFSDTILKDVRLCPSNHYIKINNADIHFVKHTDVTDLFVEKSGKRNDSAEQLTSLFLKRVQHYFPDEKSVISFTGGFDGRTLVACAKYYERQFSTFSFGTSKNDDVTVPMSNAARLGIEFNPLFLDHEEYIEKHYYETGKELINLTSGMSNYLYVHFLYSAKKLCEKSNYLFTGYFGSELFRALHVTGAMISKELLSFFKESDEDQWIDAIKFSPKLKYLKKQFFEKEIDETIDELRKYKKENTNQLSRLNQFFYQFVFEEIFRKVFGSHIFSQLNFMNVRTPFLDPQFIRELFKTEFAGVNNDFFTHNPMKRLKGQYLYANIIAKAYPELALLKTQRGYRPKDLLTVKGNVHILAPYLLKKIRRKVARPYLDNLSIISGIRHNWRLLRQEIIASDSFNIVELDKLAANLDNIPEYQRDLLALAASSARFVHQMEK